MAGDSESGITPAATRPTPENAPALGDSRRLRGLQAGIGVALVTLLAGLGYWQLGRSAETVARERRQSLRRVMLPAPRGVIYDREHRVLAGNRVRTDLVLDLGALRRELGSAHPRTLAAATRRLLDQLNHPLGRTVALDDDALAQHLARDRLRPFPLVSDLSDEEIARLGDTLKSSATLQLYRTAQRWYPHGAAAAHVLGRVRAEIVRTPVGKDFPIRNYLDTVGDSGLEQQHEATLRGRPGETVIRVDAEGFRAGSALPQPEPTPGRDLVLSLDLDLQLAAERALAAVPGSPRGAAVAIAIATGEVLALVSKPDFDLNVVSPAMAAAAKTRLDAEGAWLNRATQGLYPPGSSFKPFTVLAGLRAGTLRPEETVRCTGFIEIGGRRFRCHQADGHGELSLTEALAHSCNVYAYRVGLAAGPDALAAEARRFHFNEPTGIDLPVETNGMLVPDAPWKQAHGQSAWTSGDTVNFSIGQGFLRYSPLQAACAIASLARRETLTVPTLLHSPGRRPSGARAQEPLSISERDYAALFSGLCAVIETGIGRDAQVPGVRIAGKTGTAQVSQPDGIRNVAWFVAFAPADRPEIAVAVAIEGPQLNEEFAGAEHAAPVGRELLAAYFDKRIR